MAENLTPMMRQYQRIKSEVDPDVIVMFRLGDFYEMFFEDAKPASEILGVTLTKRNGYDMCGVPYHALDAYLGKLIRAGKKVAICDQMEDPATAKGIVRREITRIETPGTITEERALEDDCNNYLVAIADAGNESERVLGLAALDLSTGELRVEAHASTVSLVEALRRLHPGEGIVPADAGVMNPALAVLMKQADIGCISPVESIFFDPMFARSVLLRHFKVSSLVGYGVEDQPQLIAAAGALLQHVRENLRRDISHIQAIRVGQTSGVMMLDEGTCEHLDLFPRKGRPVIESLYGVLNATKTPMGARLLRNWLLRPLQDLDAIRARHDAVWALTQSRRVLTPVFELLSRVHDAERVIARISLRRGSPSDLLQVATALNVVPQLKERLGPVARGGTTGSDATSKGLLAESLEQLADLPDLVTAIETTLVENPPRLLNEGGLIRSGVNAELDELRGIASNGRSWIAQYQAKQIEETGIKTLKVKYNNVFGYFIEVTATQLDRIPPHYQRKQTIANGERYTTPELKDWEAKISGAEEKCQALEFQLFEALRDQVVAETGRIQQTATAMAQIDVLMALADRALALGYVRAEMTHSDELIIRGGRHPIVEQLPDAERFVPNDAELNGSNRQIMVVTGPNMAGKSTYIRQVAILVVMAQMGSFIPADSASIGVVDRVFTRVGASDDLARGRSTFMVEMQETANILNNATPQSLIVLDEIGRGTSTFDGISIAWAVAEYLHDAPSVKAKTLFATHYHELADLSLTLSGVFNCSVLVRERPDGIVFLRRIVEGAADKSYGISVAQLAGMPAPVIQRAREILANLEADEIGDSGKPALVEPHVSENPRRTRRVIRDEKQLLLF